MKKHLFSFLAMGAAALFGFGCSDSDPVGEIPPPSRARTY